MEVSKREVMCYLKTGNAESNERTSALIEEVAGEFKEHVTPKNVCRIFDCKACPQTVTLGEMIISSRSLAKHLEGCQNAVLLAATLGSGADMLIRRYSIQDMEKTLVAQAVSTAMIESYCDNIEKDFSAGNELKGLFSVTRYSPGYGDFDIKCQKDILKLLGASRIGLSLTDGFMLVPSKSVTAVIGYSREQKKAASKCAVCGEKNCGYREAV